MANDVRVCPVTTKAFRTTAAHPIVQSVVNAGSKWDVVVDYDYDGGTRPAGGKKGDKKVEEEGEGAFA